MALVSTSSTDLTAVKSKAAELASLRRLVSELEEYASDCEGLIADLEEKLSRARLGFAAKAQARMHAESKRLLSIAIGHDSTAQLHEHIARLVETNDALLHSNASLVDQNRKLRVDQRRWAPIGVAALRFRHEGDFTRREKLLDSVEDTRARMIGSASPASVTKPYLSPTTSPLGLATGSTPYSALDPTDVSSLAYGDTCSYARFVTRTHATLAMHQAAVEGHLRVAKADVAEGLRQLTDDTDITDPLLPDAFGKSAGQQSASPLMSRLEDLTDTVREQAKVSQSCLYSDLRKSTKALARVVSAPEVREETRVGVRVGARVSFGIKLC